MLPKKLWLLIAVVLTLVSLTLWRGGTTDTTSIAPSREQIQVDRRASLGPTVPYSNRGIIPSRSARQTGDRGDALGRVSYHGRAVLPAGVTLTPEAELQLWPLSIDGHIDSAVPNPLPGKLLSSNHFVVENVDGVHSQNVRLTVIDGGAWFWRDLAKLDAIGDSIDLGDVMLAPAPQVVTGVVVDQFETPISGVAVRAHEDIWQPLPEGSQSVTDESGAFSLIGLAYGSLVRLTAEVDGYATAWMDATAGDSVHWILARSVIVEGRVLLSAEVGWERLKVEAHSSRGHRSTTALDRRGNFQLPLTAGAGPHIVTLFGPTWVGSRVVLGRILDMNANSSTYDLGVVDLRGRIVETALEVKTATGEVVRGLDIFWHSRQEIASAPGAHETGALSLGSPNGVYRLLHSQPEQEVSLLARNVGSAKVLLAGQTAEVQLGSGYPVELRVDNWDIWPDGEVLIFWLTKPGEPVFVEMHIVVEGAVSFVADVSGPWKAWLRPMEAASGLPDQANPDAVFIVEEIATPQTHSVNIPQRYLK